MLKDLKGVNGILEKMREKESKVVFSRIGEEKDLCILGIRDASYHQSDSAVAGEMIRMGSKKSMAASPMFWRFGVIRKVCLSPKAAETRALVKTVDDSLFLARQMSQLLGTEVGTRMFTDSRPLLESIGSSVQIDEKSLRMLAENIIE